MKDALSRLLEIVDSQPQLDDELGGGNAFDNLSSKEARRLFDKYGDPICAEQEQEVMDNGQAIPLVDRSC